MSADTTQDQDAVPELPAGPSAAAALANTAVHNALHDDNADTAEGQRPTRRRGSTTSRVDIGYFDPSGVRQLERTLSRSPVISRSTPRGFPEGQPPEQWRASSGSSSDATIQEGVEGKEEAFDFEKKLRMVIQKFEEEEIKRRELGVMFQDLRVVGLGASASYQPTLGSLFDPRKLAGTIQAARHPPVRDILSGFEGVVRPGEMLLVLGSPGSGCSTLLKTLANQRQEYHAINGEVLYDSFSPEEIENHYRGDVQYCPEDDVHFPTLTVDETLRFAAKTRAPRARIEGSTRSQFIDTMTDIMETIFGLKAVRDTAVGDARIRGISGGQKKRVSIAEALATRGLLGSWDNSTRGLDASTALEFVRALRIATDNMRLTTIVSIYQAGESLYQLFDKVCVIDNGRMAYFGPADQARQYFIDMGFKPHNRQTTADFLVSVTDPKGRELRDDIDPAMRVPSTSHDFAEYFKSSELGRRNEEDIDSYRNEFTGKTERTKAYRDSVKQERAKRTRGKSPFTISIFMQAKALMQRRLQILKGSIVEQVIQSAAFIIQAIIIGSVFLKVPDSTSAFFSRGGVLFFALLFTALTTMAEIPALFAQRPIVHRQSRAAMYHPFVEGLAMTLVDMPITFITIAIFAVILYFMVGLQQSAGQFFIFLLFIYSMTLVMKAYFRMLAAAFKSPAPAQTVAGLSVLLFVLYTGYVIPRPSLPGGLRWVTWINPLRYGYEGVLTNEFSTLNGVCAGLVPSGPGYENVAIANQACPAVGSQPGQSTVNGNTYAALSYGYSRSNLWRNFGVMVAFGLGFVSLLLVFWEFNAAIASQSSVTLFKRGSKAAVLEEAENDVNGDEEKGARRGEAQTDAGVSEAEAEEAIEAQPAMKDIFSWQNLNYTVPISGGQQRQLLENVSGYVSPGKLTALMGESGAGKTTLLNVLAQRTDTGVVTGERYVNGQALPPDFQAQTGYCQQTDTHLETDTVREALLFSAMTRQPQSVPAAEKQKYVELCLKMCGLEAYADAIVGSLGVEHRKRTTIGVELAAKPKLLLFLDEPTSGLDSQSAWAIMQFLRKLAESGQAILCTIHQPSAELFQIFDRLLLLKKGGQTVYFGDLGHHAQTIIDYFEGNGSQKIPPDANPAEWMLEVIGAGATATTDRNWHDVWVRSPRAKALRQDIEEIHAEGRKGRPVEASLDSELATSWMHQLRWLLRRNFVHYWRSVDYIFAKFALCIAGGLLIGFTFFQAGSTQQDTQNKLFAIFMGTILSVPLSNQIQVPFLSIRSLYEIRERPSRMYSWTALIASLILVELPFNILGSASFYFSWYWTVGFDSSRAGYTFLMFAIIFPLYYTTIAQAVAAMSPSPEIAALLFSFLFSFVLTFCGVQQPFRELGWWQWMYRLSPYTYLIEGILGNAIGNMEITCAAKELATIQPPSGQSCSSYLNPYISMAGGYLINPDATSGCQLCSTRTTNQFLEPSFNIFYANRWRDVGLMFAYIVFNISAIFAFTYLFRIHKGGFGLGKLFSRKK